MVTGVPAVICDGNICRLYPAAALLVGGAKVVVDQRNEEQALDVLELVLPGNPPYAGSFVTVPLSLPALFFMLLRRPRIPEELPPDDVQPC